MGENKLISASTAASMVHDGDSVVLFGGYEPVCIIRELLRQKKGGLRLCAYHYGFSSDLLLRCGEVEQLLTTDVLPGGRVPPAVCRTVTVPVSVLHRQLAAAVAGVDYALVNGSTELTQQCAPLYRRTPSLFGDEGTQLAAAALHPDVALIHVPRADFDGNIQFDPADDTEAEMLRLAAAAKIVLVSAEQIVSAEAMTQNISRTILTARQVSGVVDAPYGGYPVGCGVRYGADDDFLRRYEQAARRDDTLQIFLAKQWGDFCDWDGFLDFLGFDRLMSLTTNRRGE